MEPITQIIFRSGLLASLLQQRSDRDAGLSVHGVAKRDMDRYYALIRAAPPRLSLVKARVLTAVVNGGAAPDGDAYVDALRMMPVEVRDALDDPPINLDPADGQALPSAMRAWTLLQRAAVLDAIERI